MKKKITLKYIAERLNVSATTVSKALKDYPDISTETKLKVKALVDELGYYPTSLIANISNSKKGTIAVIIPEIVHHFFSEVVSGILQLAEKKGYLVIIFQSMESYVKEIKQCEALLRDEVDGLLISLSNETENTQHIQNLIDKGVKVLQFDKVDNELQTPKVVVNDYQSAFEITEHLIKTGKRNIAHITGSMIPRNAKDRLKGYRDALIKNNMSFNSDFVFRTKDNSDKDGYNSTKKILKGYPEIDAIFCVTDLLAIGSIRALHEARKKIPDDIAVAGFSNWHISSLITPSLTTCDQPGRLIGETAIKLLIDAIEDKSSNHSSSKIYIPTQLIIREST